MKEIEVYRSFVTRTLERYRPVSEITAHPKIEERVPLHYIASHLGITPTQLSRIRKKMKKNKPNQHM